MFSLRIVRSAVVIAGCMAALPAHSDVSFRGKSIRMLIGTPVGGGTDQNARLVAQFLAKYLPGLPTIVPQNMPGADGVTAMNYFAQQVKPDGLTFIAGFSTEVTPEVLQGPNVKYDPTTFHHFGGIAASGVVMVADKDAIMRLGSHDPKPVVVAQVGNARVAAQLLLWGSEYLDWNLKWVTGYQGTAELTMALLNGEADMTQTGNVANLAPMMQTGNFGLVAQLGVFANGKLRRRDAFPDTPLFHDLVADKIPASARSAFQASERTSQLGKFFSLPAGSDADLVATYRKAFEQTIQDPEFKTLASRQMDADYVIMTGDDVASLLQDVMNIRPEDMDYLTRLRQKYGL